MRIRRELTRVLKYIDSCTIEGQVKIKNRVRIRVKCGSVSDFVSVVPARQGTAWRITADDRYPGLLPNLYKKRHDGQSLAPPQPILVLKVDASDKAFSPQRIWSVL